MTTNLNETRRCSNTFTSSSSSPNAINEPKSPQILGERHRSSAGSGAGLFPNLQVQKRESGDAGMAGRRASWNEQREQGGLFSNFWNGYTQGK